MDRLVPPRHPGPARARPPPSGPAPSRRRRAPKGGPTDLLPLTLPEVRRLLLAPDEPPEWFGARLARSAFRRRHQAVAEPCHAARRAQRQSTAGGGPPIQVLPAEWWARRPAPAAAKAADRPPKPRPPHPPRRFALA